MEPEGTWPKSGGPCGTDARAMAEECGWKYEELPGDLSLLVRMLTTEQTDDEVLVVPPGQVTVYDALSSRLAAAPTNEAGAGRRPSTPAEVEEPPPASPTGSEGVRIGLGIDAGGTYTDAVAYDFASDSVLAKGKALTTRWDFSLGICEALDSLDAELLRRVDLVAVSTTLATNAIVEGQGQKVGLLVMPPYGLFDDADVPHEP